MEIAGRETRVGVHPNDAQELLRDIQASLAAEEMARRRPFGELAREWLLRMESRRVCPDNERRHIEHLAELAQLREGELTKATVETAFAKLVKPKGPLGPATINKLRSTAAMVVRDAQANGEWRGANPFQLVKPMKVPKRKYVTLELEEAADTLRALREDRRRLVKVLLHVGMRPGEALALQKADLDFKHGMMVVRRSHGRDTTKTGRDREFPIPAALVADLKEAVRESPSELVFPGPDGRRQRHDMKLSKVLQSAMKAAHVVTGFRAICRYCRFEEERQDGRPGRCPKCTRKLWLSARTKAIRFYDLRHTCATLLRKAGCDPLVIQLVLGHATTSTTDSTYSHLDEAYIRRELNKLKLRKGTTMPTKRKR